MVKKIFIEKLNKDFYMDYDTKRLYSDEDMSKEIYSKFGYNGYGKDVEVFVIHMNNKTFKKNKDILFYESFKEDILKNGIEGQIWKTAKHFVKKELKEINGVLISNHGNIMKNGVIIKKDKLTIDSSGYYIYSTTAIHRIVMIAFKFEGYNKDLVVNHIDGNKLNNDIENLEWCTNYENARHAIEVLGKYYAGENNHASKLTNEQAEQIRIEYDKKNGITQSVLSKKYGVAISTISRILKNKRYKI